MSAEAAEILHQHEDCLEAPKYTCALGGALSVTSNIHRVVPIIHAGSGCGMNQLVWFRESGGHQGVGYVGGLITPSSNLSEKEVVFGGEGRLREQIEATLDLIDGDLYIVLPGCIPGIIGDDVASVVREFEDHQPKVIHAATAGFSGNNFKGYEAFFSAVIDQFLEPQPQVKGLVNIFGVVPYQDLFWRGNLRKIKGLLEKIGLSVNPVVGNLGGVDALRNISAAQYNLVLSSWVGHDTAQRLEEKFGIRSFVWPQIPVGPRDTSEFLRAVGSQFGVSADVVEEVVAAEERQAYQDFDLAGDSSTMFSSSFPFAVVANSPTAIGITRFLTNEAGFTPTVVVINDNPPEEARNTIENALSSLESGLKPKIVYEIDSYKIRNVLQKSDFKLLFASSSEKHFAAEHKALFLSVTHPANDRLIVNASYASYDGGITLLEAIMDRFIMPY